MWKIYNIKAFYRMVFYKKRATAAKKIQRAARRKFVAKRKPIPRMPRSGNTDSIKVRMSRSILRSDMLSSPDDSLYCNIFFLPSKNVSTTFTSGQANLFYHADFQALGNLYELYKVSCIVMEFKRPDVWIKQPATGTGEDNWIKCPTQEWGTEILHTRQVFKPDALTGSMQTVSDLTPRQTIYYPTSYREAVDDGAQRFKTAGYKRNQKRIYKPSTYLEKKWKHRTLSDSELALGGIHCRIKNGIFAIPNVPVENASVRNEQVMFDVTATVYMSYSQRI